MSAIERFTVATCVTAAWALSAIPSPAQLHPAHPQRAASAEPDGPLAVFDTSAGRIVCRLYTTRAPRTAANFIALATGATAWSDESGTAQPGKPFYDGMEIFGTVGGLSGGSREDMAMGSAGSDLPPEKTDLTFDRPGRLAAVISRNGQSRSEFAFSDHANSEFNKRAIVFGQCNDASTELISNIEHELMSTDNHPKHPVVLRRVLIVPESQPLPPPAPAAEDEEYLVVAPAPRPIFPPPDPTGPIATIDTTMGTLHCRLFSKEAPIGVANFIGLATGAKAFVSPRTHASVRGKHFYDGLTFSRVIPDFMIQNGDIPGDPGGGGSIGHTFGNELQPDLTFDRPGRLAYANAGPGTNSSEFFITEHPLRRLDDNYTIFGQCDDDSVKIAAAIARVPRDIHNKPLTPVVIRHVTIAPATN